MGYTILEHTQKNCLQVAINSKLVCFIISFILKVLNFEKKSKFEEYISKSLMYCAEMLDKCFKTQKKIVVHCSMKIS